MAERSYADYRRELMSASVRVTAAAVTGVTVLFQLAVAIAHYDHFLNEWLPNLVQLIVPIAGWLAYRGPFRAYPVGILQCAESSIRRR